MTDETDPPPETEAKTVTVSGLLTRSVKRGLNAVVAGIVWTMRTASWAGLAFLLGALAFMLILGRTKRNIERHLGTVTITNTDYEEYQYDNASRVEFQVSGEMILPRDVEWESERIEVQSA